jgi:hypothetical protein
MFVIVMRWIVIVIWWPILRWTRYALALDDYTIALPQPMDSLRRIALESFLTAGWFRSPSRAYAFLHKQETRRHALLDNAQSASHAPVSGPI